MLLPFPSTPLTPVFVVFEDRKPVLEPTCSPKTTKIKKKEKDKCTSNVQESGKYTEDT
jgi:hypothetical protein